MNDKLEAFRAILESQQRAHLAVEYPGLQLDTGHYFASIKMGRKYANIDFGGSGKYMVELATGAIYGIKAYGVIHRGHYFGTLDTLADWDWSGYRASKRKQAA